MASKFLDSRANSFYIAADGDNPVFHNLPRTDGNFSKTYTTTTDETMVKERGSKPDVITASSVGGDFTCNLRISNDYLILRQSAMQSDPPVAINIGESLTYNHQSEKLSGADFTAIKKGTYFKLEYASGSVCTYALSDGTASDLWCKNIPSNKTEFYRIKTSYLVTGSTKTPYYMQKRVDGYDANSAAPKVFYRSFYGVQVFTWAISMPNGGILSETYNMRGLSLIGNDQITGQTDADAALYPPTDALGSVKGVNAIDFNGERFTSCYAQNFEFSVDNQGEETTALGTEGACVLTYKDPVITGSLNTFALSTNPFSEETLIDNQTLIEISVTLYDNTQDKYMVISGKAKFNSLETDLSGNSTIKNVGLKYEGKVYIYIM